LLVPPEMRWTKKRTSQKGSARENFIETAGRTAGKRQERKPRPSKGVVANGGSTFESSQGASNRERRDDEMQEKAHPKFSTKKKEREGPSPSVKTERRQAFSPAIGKGGGEKKKREW